MSQRPASARQILSIYLSIDLSIDLPPPPPPPPNLNLRPSATRLRSKLHLSATCLCLSDTLYVFILICLFIYPSIFLPSPLASGPPVTNLRPSATPRLSAASPPPSDTLYLYCLSIYLSIYLSISLSLSLSLSLSVYLLSTPTPAHSPRLGSALPPVSYPPPPIS